MEQLWKITYLFKVKPGLDQNQVENFAEEIRDDVRDFHLEEGETFDLHSAEEANPNQLEQEAEQEGTVKPY